VDDIRPPRPRPRPQPQPQVKTPAQVPVATQHKPREASPEPAQPAVRRLAPTRDTVQNIHPVLVRRRRRLTVALIITLIGFLTCVGLWVGYLIQLQPVNTSDTSAQKVVIKSGQTFGEIAQYLQQRSLIRSPLAFEIMARLSGKHNDVKAGTCVLHRNETATQILDKITSGCHDFKSITFYPGATLYKSRSKPTSMDVTDVMLAAGYSQEEVDGALEATYTTKGIDLFAGKPAGASLEGYVYGETYYVDVDASAQEVLQTTFDQMASDIQTGGYVEKFKAHSLTLYQGITLASIVQRELSCSSGATACYQDQETIAQIFYTRYTSGMTLGSDVTFYYAADKLGVDPSTTIDSLYNTRRYAGLPPGPIAAPGKHALDAVANPASTDYLFFVAGDDGTVHYARTDAEHEANIAKYCLKLCSEL